MTQLDLFHKVQETGPYTIMCSELYLTLGDLIKIDGEVFEVCSAHKHNNGSHEYTYRSYEGPL